MLQPTERKVPAMQVSPELVAVLQGLAAGDLTAILDPADFPGHEPLVEAVAVLASRMRSVLEVFDEAIQKLSYKDALQVVHIRRLTRAVQEQSRQLNALNESINDLTQAVSAVAELATATAADMQSVLEQSREGFAGAVQAAEALQALSSDIQHARSLVERQAAASAEVAEGVSIIDRVARDTRILSINASIQAAHAGDLGRGFAVIATEVGQLAEQTTSSAAAIARLLAGMRESTKSAAQTMNEVAAAAEKASGVGNRAQSGIALVEQLIGNATDRVNGIAAASEEATAATTQARDISEALAHQVGESARSLTLTADLAVEDVSERAHAARGQFRLGNRFDHMIELSRTAALKVQQKIEDLIPPTRVLELFDTHHQEVRGPAVRKLARLFDVSRVPPAGFTPPKYATRYDHLVDEPLIDLLESLMQEEPTLGYSSVVDLNGFCVALPRRLCRDWTGDETHDLAGNRVKRMFEDTVGLKSARVGLPKWDALPQRAGAEELRQAAGLGATPEAGMFLVQTYAQDTGAVLKDVAIPLFVHGRRWGALRLGYQAQN